MILAGAWLLVLGYGVLYAGLGKLSGDPSYTIGKAFKGQTPAASKNASFQGATAADQQQYLIQQQQSTVPQTVLV